LRASEGGAAKTPTAETEAARVSPSRSCSAK
jgi:hypothetical protein